LGATGTSLASHAVRQAERTGEDVSLITLGVADHLKG